MFLTKMNTVMRNDYPPPCECTTVCLRSVNWPLSCLSDIRMPLRCLGSSLEGLLDGYKDPPKTAGVASGTIQDDLAQSALPPGGLLDDQDASRRPKDGSKTPSRCPKSPPRGSKIPQDASKMP